MALINYSKRILYFLMLIAVNSKDIPIKIPVSFHSSAIPTPLSITPFRIIINHLAGIILLMYCNGNGILEIGKIKPDSKITGSINPISEIIRAACWVFAIVEINTPRVNEVIINKMLSIPSKNKLPLTGTLNTKMLKTMMTTALIIDKNIYGKTLPIITKNGFKGDTKRISIVPNSFSRVIEIEVIIAETSIRITVITPGTKLKTLFISEL